MRNFVFAVFVPVALLSSAPALASGIEPEDAQAKREQLDPNDAGVLATVAEEHGDPELFLQASDLLHADARASRDLELAERALPLAMRARDIALYLSNDDRYGATDWHPITRDRASALADEANRAVAALEELMIEIVEERLAAEADTQKNLIAETASRRKQAKAGTGLIAGGSVALTMGAGGIVMLGVGLARGAQSQREVESLDPVVNLNRILELDRQGARANAVGYAGGVLGVAGVAAGLALIAVGVRKRDQAGRYSASGFSVGGYLVGTQGGGLQLSGRF